MDETATGKGVVIIVSDPSADAWWRLSILNRSDLHVYPTKGYGTGLELLTKMPCSLLVVEERPGGGLLEFLDDIRKAFESPAFKVVLLCDRLHPGPPVPPVTRILPRPCSLNPFNLCIAELLALQPRKSHRHLVRIQLGLTMEKGSMLGPAATLDLSGDGMRVETAIPLDLGKQYIWTFSGITELAGLKLPGTILRVEPPVADGSMHRYAVRFNHTNPAARHAVEHYLGKGF